MTCRRSGLYDSSPAGAERHGNPEYRTVCAALLRRCAPRNAGTGTGQRPRLAMTGNDLSTQAGEYAGRG
jgi:hypothetical protein